MTFYYACSYSLGKYHFTCIKMRYYAVFDFYTVAKSVVYSCPYEDIYMTYPEVRHRYVMKVKRWVLPEIDVVEIERRIHSEMDRAMFSDCCSFETRTDFYLMENGL